MQYVEMTYTADNPYELRTVADWRHLRDMVNNGTRPIYAMHLLSLTPAERHRALGVIAAYYRLHLPNFPQLRSLELLGDML